MLPSVEPGSLILDFQLFRAYNSYMQGQHLRRKRMEEHLRPSITDFERAIALDSNYAQAYAGRAKAWAVLPGIVFCRKEKVSYYMVPVRAEYNG